MDRKADNPSSTSERRFTTSRTYRLTPSYVSPEKYDTMMRDLDKEMADRDHAHDNNLRELFQSRRKLWELYPRVGALEDRLFRHAKDDGISDILKKYKSTSSLNTPSNTPRARTSSYSSYTPSRSTSDRWETSSYHTPSRSTSDRWETSSVQDYGKYGKRNYDPIPTSTYTRKRGGDRWETQSLADYSSGSSKYRPSSKRYGTGTSDYETSSVRSASRTDDDPVMRWRSRNQNYVTKKTYDDWSPPRYSRRAPINPYLHEPDLTTSYQSARTLGKSYSDAGDDEEEEPINLSRYSKVPLTERAVGRHDAYYGRYNATPSPSERDDSSVRSYRSDYSASYEPTKPKYRANYSSTYSPSTSYTRPTARSSTRYETSRRRYADNLDTSPTRYSSRLSSYSDTSPTRYSTKSDDRLSDAGSVGSYTRKTSRYGSSSNTTPSYTSSASRYSTRPERYGTESYEAARAARIKKMADEKPRSIYPIYMAAATPPDKELEDLQKSRYGKHLPLRTYGSLVKYVPRSGRMSVRSPSSQEEFDRDPMGFLYDVLNAQAKILSYCVSKMDK